MDLQERLKELLLKIPSARLSNGGREVTLRCMYCGDSKNPKSAHLGVSLGYNNEPLYFHCFKCHTSGLINHQTLISWGVYDNEVLVDINKYNGKVLSLDKNKKFKDRTVYKLNNTFISDNKLSEVKLKYINNRLGTNLNYNDLMKNKIILNLYDLLNNNNIQKLTRDINLVNQLNESFIGFISQDNAFINLRNLRPGKVDKPIDKRYINYNIFGKFNNTERYYTIPTKIDLLRPQRIKLNIAEGPFDILSVYYNLRKGEDHAIYSSILGSGYVNIIKYFICNMRLINLEVHIYIDNDVSGYVINEVKELLDIYQMPFYLHRNMMPGEKDFGVTIDRIKEQVELVY